MPSLKILALISLTTALLGSGVGLILRLAPPASLAGISGLGKTQSFPKLDWPGGGLAGDMPLDVPAPEPQSDQDAGSLSSATRQSLRDRSLNTRPLREVLPPDSAEEAPVFEPIPEPEDDSERLDGSNRDASSEGPQSNPVEWNQPQPDQPPEPPSESRPEVGSEPRPSQGDSIAPAPIIINNSEPSPTEDSYPEPSEPQPAPLEPLPPSSPTENWSEPAAPAAPDSSGGVAPSSGGSSNEAVF